MNQRMAKLKPKGSAAHRRPVAEIVLKHPKGALHALGHLDEVQELKRGGQKITGEGTEEGNKDRLANRQRCFCLAALVCEPARRAWLAR